MPSDVDLSEFEALNPEGKGRCKVAAAIEEVPEADHAQLAAALAADKRHISNAAIIKWLGLRQVEGVSNSALTSHRRGTCSCVR